MTSLPADPHSQSTGNYMVKINFHKQLRCFRTNTGAQTKATTLFDCAKTLLKSSSLVKIH